MRSAWTAERITLTPAFLLAEILVRPDAPEFP
jgi:hypothetical protein